MTMHFHCLVECIFEKRDFVEEDQRPRSFYRIEIEEQGSRSFVRSCSK